MSSARIAAVLCLACVAPLAGAAGAGAGAHAGAGAAAGAASSDATTAKTIRWAAGQVTHIGSLRTSSSRTRPPTLGRAIAAFGRPTSTRRTSQITCVVSWSKLGLRATFANLGGIPPGGQTICSPAVGLLATATIRGRAFQTPRGLRVGDATARLKALHSGARFRQGSWWLATAPAVFGDVEPGERFPIVRAFTQASRVTIIALHIGAAGE